MPETDLFHAIAGQFQQTTALEWIGTITGFLCVYLAARQHILNWPVSIISVIAYIILFYESKLYGDSLLQFYFLGTAIYGWYHWIKRKQEKQKPVIVFHPRQMLVALLIIIMLSGILGFLLQTYTDSDVPYIDGACTAVSFVAQFLMTRKVLQNWLLWIVVDVCYIPLYLYKELALTAVLYALFAAIAYMGYVDWRKSWKESN